jgi:hypothetical protein
MPAATEQKTPAEAGEGDHYAQRGARDLRIARTEISREAARCYDSEVYGFQLVNRSPDSVQIAATVHRGISKLRLGLIALHMRRSTVERMSLSVKRVNSISPHISLLMARTSSTL